MHKTLPPSIYMHPLPWQADIAKWPGQLFQKPVLPTLSSCLPSYPLSASLAKKTLHCCVAFHQVYLPDFERKARVGVRAQPARNHWKKRQRHIKSSSYTRRIGGVLLLLQGCLAWLAQPLPSGWTCLRFSSFRGAHLPWSSLKKPTRATSPLLLLLLIRLGKHHHKCLFWLMSTASCESQEQKKYLANFKICLFIEFIHVRCSSILQVLVANKTCRNCEGSTKINI